MEELDLKGKILALLNKALSSEYRAQIQYEQGYGVLTGAEYMAIREAFAAHAKEEQAHALTLSDLIQFYGGTPTLESDKAETGKDAESILKVNLEAEVVAIELYRKVVKQLMDAGNYEAVPKILGIIEDEQEHADEIMLALGK